MRIFKPLMFLSFLFFGLVGTTSAQKTAVYEKGEEVFLEGVNLFEKKQFGASNERMGQYLRLDDQDPLLSEQALIYQLMNHVRLHHRHAATDLEKYLKRHPENALNNLAIYTLGNYYFDLRKFKRAGRLFEDLDVSNLPKELWEEAHFKMGYSFFKRKNYEDAKGHFNKIRNQKGEYYDESNYYYGYICYFKKDYDCAISSFKRIKDSGPKIMDLYIAQIYYAQEGYQAAINHAESKYDEKYSNEYNLLLGKCYFQIEEFDKCSSYFEKIDPDFRLNQEEIYQMGFANYNKGDYKEAVSSFVQISGSSSALGQLANYQLGQSFLQLKDKEQAINAFAVAKVMKYHPEIQETSHFNYAKLAYELGRPDATKSMQQFISNYPKSKSINPAKRMLADMFLKTNNYEQAVAILEDIKQFDSKTQKIYQKITYQRAEQLFADRDYVGARNYLVKALKYTPDTKLKAQSYFWLGEIKYIKNDYSAAIKDYSRFLNSSGSRSSNYKNLAYYNMGYSYYLQKNYASALNYFSKYKDNSSYQDDPSRYLDNSLRLGDSYFLKSQYSKALSSYGTVASKKTTGSDYASYQQGIIYGLLRQPNKKITTLQNIRTNYKNSVYLDDAIFEIGNTYLQDLNELDNAADYFNEIITKYDSGLYAAESYLKLSLIFYQQGKDNQALSYCKRVVEKYPRTSSSQEALKLIEAIYVKNGNGAEYLDYIATIPNSEIRITYQDSLLYESAIRKYRSGDCPSANEGFDDYIERFGKSGFFLLHVNFYKAECAYAERKITLAQKHYKYVADQPRNEFSEEAHLKLAESFYAQTRYDKALPYYSKLERISNSKDNYVVSLVGQMRCNYALNSLSAAKANAVDILPIENISKEYLIEANLILGKIHLAENNLLSAEFSFDYVRKESKTVKGAEAQFYKCQILYDQKKYKDCRNEIFTLNDEFASYEYWVVRGFILLSDVYVAEEDFFQARATLKSILDFYEGDQSLIDQCNSKLKTIDELEAAKNAVPEEEEE